MKIKNGFLIFCVFLGVLFSFCHKKGSDEPQPIVNSSSTSGTHSNPPKPYKTVYVSNELKEWGLFDVGSYWIYRDSITGVVDSLYVSSIEVTTPTLYYTGDSNVVSETISIKTNGYVSFILSSYPYDHISMYYQYPSYGSFFNLDSNIIDSQYGVLMNYSKSSLTVLGNIYSNIRYTRVLYSFYAQSSGQYFRDYGNYWKKNVGRIKFRNYLIPQSSQYYCKELLRYSVIQ